MDKNFTDDSVSGPTSGLRVRVIAPAGTPMIGEGPVSGAPDWNDGTTGLRVRVIAPAGTPLLPAGAPMFPEAAKESLRVKVIAPAGTPMFGENA
jgi:hypothetical protein